MSLVRLERDESGLATASFDSPPLNLFNRQLMEDLRAAIGQVEADPPRALLFRAEGRAVSGGVDVHEFAGLTPERGSELWDELIGTVERVEALPLPVVFAAHALTLTAAFELALGCDLILAARSAQFGLVEKVVGLTPSMGGTQRLAERAGSGRARHFVMSGELFGAEEMERWGVVNLLFDDEGFDQRARDYAAESTSSRASSTATSSSRLSPTLADGARRPPRGSRARAAGLFVRSASRQGRPVVTMRARDLGDACVVEIELEGREEGTEAPSYSFADAQQASTFVTEAVEALVYLGCEIHA